MKNRSFGFGACGATNVEGTYSASQGPDMLWLSHRIQKITGECAHGHGPITNDNGLRGPNLTFTHQPMLKLYQLTLSVYIYSLFIYK